MRSTRGGVAKNLSTAGSHREKTVKTHYSCIEARKYTAGNHPAQATEAQTVGRRAARHHFPKCRPACSGNPGFLPGRRDLYCGTTGTRRSRATGTPAEFGNFDCKKKASSRWTSNSNQAAKKRPSPPTGNDQSEKSRSRSASLPKSRWFGKKGAMNLLKTLQKKGSETSESPSTVVATSKKLNRRSGRCGGGDDRGRPHRSGESIGPSRRNTSRPLKKQAC